MKRFVAALLLTSAVSACVPMHAVQQQAPSERSAEVEDGAYGPQAIARGREHGSGNFWGLHETVWSLGSSISKETGVVVRGISFSNNYSGNWRFWKMAATEDSKSLNVINLRREVGSCGRSGCSHYETVFVDIPEKYFKSVGPKGIKLKLSADSGYEFYIHIPPEEIAEHNAAFEPLREKYGKNNQ